MTVLVGDEEQTNDELDVVRQTTLMEVGNIVMNSVLGSIMNVFKKRIDYTIPEYGEGSFEILFKQGLDLKSDKAVFAKTQFSVKDMEIKGDILIIFDIDSIESIFSRINEMIEENKQ